MTTLALSGLVMLALLTGADSADDAKSKEIEAVQVKVEALIGVFDLLPRLTESNVEAGAWDGTGTSNEGFQLTADGHLDYGKVSGFTVLSNPVVVSIAGQESRITMASPGTDLLEPVEGQPGIYRACHIDDGPAVSLSCVANPNADGTINLDFNLDVSRLVGREPLDGLDLDVGRPIFAKRTMTSTLACTPGYWFTHRLYMSGDSDECLVIYIQVSPV